MAAKAKVTYPRRGEVYWVDFDPPLGAEIQKTRPTLILQNDIANRYSPVTIVAAITSKFSQPLYPADVLVKIPEGGLKADSVVMLDQVRSIDKRRLGKYLGRLRAETMEQVNRAIMISFGLVDI
jgi:mRNA interferase MazF